MHKGVKKSFQVLASVSCGNLCCRKKTVRNGLDFNSSTKLPTFVMEKAVTNYRERGEVA